jgi:hypothetical protein
VAAAVLVYRALTWFLPIPIGVGTYLWWRADTTRREAEREREARQEPGVAVEGSP